MKVAEIVPIKGAPQVYPLWNEITMDVFNNPEIIAFRSKKIKEGYSMVSSNIFWKDGVFFWLMFDKAKNYACHLLAYAAGDYT